MLNYRFRKNISLVLFIGLMVSTAFFWTMTGSIDASMRDGVHTATASGFGGEMTVAVTISDGSIVGVEITEHGETPFIADPAFETLTAAVVEGQTSELDGVSGATVTSNAFMEAVEKAIQAASTSYTDGVHVSSVESFGGEMTVQVTVEGGALVAVEVTEHNDTPFIADDAIETLTEAMVTAGTPQVDIVSGATVTSDALIEAVNDALATE